MRARKVSLPQHRASWHSTRHGEEWGLHVLCINLKTLCAQRRLLRSCLMEGSMVCGAGDHVAFESVVDVGNQ